MLTPLPDAHGRPRPSFAPTCCKVGIWVLHPKKKVWCCSECAVYGPLRRNGAIDRVAWTVALSDDEWARAVEEGKRARKNGLRVGRVTHGQRDAEAAAAHVQAAASELSLHLLTGLAWPMPYGRGPDVGHVHVRATPYAAGHLILNAAAPDGTPNTHPDPDGIYALAIGRDRDWRFVGWTEMPGALADAVYRRWDPSRPPCYGVPQAKLNPMDALPGDRRRR